MNFAASPKLEFHRAPITRLRTKTARFTSEAVTGNAQDESGFIRKRRHKTRRIPAISRNLEQTIGQSNSHVNSRCGAVSSSRTVVFRTILSCEPRRLCLPIQSRREIETALTSHCVFSGLFLSRLLRKDPENLRFQTVANERSDSLPGGRLSASKSDCRSARRVASGFCVGYHLG